MKLVTVLLPEAYLTGLDELVRSGMYPSRSAAIRAAVRDIALLSECMTLEPGDLIFTGTPAGNAPLADGDVVEIEIEGLGKLINPVKKKE